MPVSGGGRIVSMHEPGTHGTVLPALVSARTCQPNDIEISDWILYLFSVHAMNTVYRHRGTLFLLANAL